MKCSCTLLFIILFVPLSIYTQTITGKLVDQAGVGLSGLQLKLYVYPETYVAISDSDGFFSFFYVLTGIKEKQLPTGYAVSNNFPNPFNPRTRIFIILPTDGTVKVDVYNLLGQKVRDEFEKYFDVGTSYIDLELSGLPNGIYIAQITIDEKYTVTKKLMLLYGSQHLTTSNTQAMFNAQSSNISSSDQILNKTVGSIKIDSLVIIGASINKNTFNNLGVLYNDNFSLGNIIVNTATSGLPCPGIPTITYLGKKYSTIQIGTQCWLKENLDVGTMVYANQNQEDNAIIEKYCYNNDINNCATYGGLYQWAEAVQYKDGATNTTSTNLALGSTIKGICPSGWHIPTKAEFLTLSAIVNENSNELKAIGQGIGSSAGTNTSGFSALISGDLEYNGRFRSFGYYTYFWSSTEYDAVTSSYMGLDFGYRNIYFFDYLKVCGYSVRCIKD